MEGNAVEGGQAAARVRYAAPAWTLLAVNVIPLVGVLLWGWSAFHVVALYWLENIILGVINVLKIITCSPDREAVFKQLAKVSADRHLDPSETNLKSMRANATTINILVNHLPKLFLLPFFIFHYGGFCFVHGIFVYTLLGSGFGESSNADFLSDINALFTTVFSGGGLIAVLALVGSHLFSFAYHYIGQGEYRRTNVIDLMKSPYARIAVLHIALIAGAFAIVLLGQPILLLVILVIGKTALDWKLHTRAHEKML